MRFRTIWTLRYLPLMERLRRTRDWLAMTIGHRLPLRMRYWVAIQEIGYATRYSPNVPDTPCGKIIEELRRPKYVS